MTIAPHRAPRGRTLLATAVAGALAASFAPAASFAAGADGALEDVVVTAQRRTESLMTVPIPISAISDVQIEKQRMNSVEDILAQVPNVSFVSLGSRDRKEISMRGVSNQLNPFAGSRAATDAFYNDEFNVAVGTSNPEILDIERIEVLRGPQGTYFGRNAVGGAINVVTKKPDNELFSEVGLGYGNNATWNAHAIANLPIIEDKVAFRVSGQTRHTDGFIENINAIGGGNDGEFNTARAMLRFTPDERTTFDLTYSYTDGEEGMRVGVPTGFLTATWRAVYYQNRPGNVANPDGVGFFPDNRDRVNFNRPQSVGSTFEYLSGRLQYDFDATTLTVVAGHLTSDLYNFGDVDGGSIDAFYEDLVVDRDSRSVEVRLASRGDRRLEWSVGAMGGQDNGVLNQKTFHGAQSPLGRPNGFEITGADSDTTNEYWAVFGQVTWNITDTFDAIIGGRYSQEEVKTIGQTRSNTVLTGVNNRTADFSDFSPRVTLSWSPPGVGLIYATASKGFKAGGTQTSGTAQLRNDYDPEELWNYELGWKTEFLDKRVRVDVSAFYMDWKDVQQFIRFQFIDQTTGLLRAVTGIDNATKATSQGIELSADALVFDGLRLGARVGYLDAEYGDWPNALIDGQLINATGKPLINAPEWTVGLSAEYTRTLSAALDGFVRAEWNYRSEQLSNTFALRYETWPFIAPSFDYFNLRAGINGARWSVNAYAENLTDENFFQNSYEKAFYSGVQVEPSTREFGVDVRFRFGGNGLR
jgi:iron complex outermembrane receptor protein